MYGTTTEAATHYHASEIYEDQFMELLRKCQRGVVGEPILVGSLFFSLDSVCPHCQDASRAL